MGRQDFAWYFWNMSTGREMLRLEYYLPMVFNFARILIILALALAFTFLVGRILRALRNYIVRMMLKAGGGSEYEIEKRVKTVSGVTRKVLIVVVWTVAWIMILKEMNFDIRPLLAGAGVIGVALGFGAQSIVKDMLSGFFLLTENQIRVNDVAIINGKGGLVEEINLRTTVLRDEDGTVHIFPNGAIQGISNLTREYSYYLFKLTISYTVDSDRAVEALKSVAAQLSTEEPYKDSILAPLEVMGLGIDPALENRLRGFVIGVSQRTVGRDQRTAAGVADPL